MRQTIFLNVQGNLRRNDMRELLMAFFPYGTIVLADSKTHFQGVAEEIDGNALEKSERSSSHSFLDVLEGDRQIRARFVPSPGSELVLDISYDEGANVRQKAKRLVYDLLSQATGQTLKWGTMTGIRPVRIAHKGLMEGKILNELRSGIQEEYRLSKEALDQILAIAVLEVDALYPLDPKKIEVYINIPFCPSRCSYCSFITQEAGTNQDLLDWYLEALMQEMKILGDCLRDGEWNVESIYVGGGTPTVLSVQQLERLLKSIETFIPMKYLTEYTVEGGRPDTLSPDKLSLLRRYGVDRISVNPQSFHEKTLKSLGRKHSVADFYEAYEWARQASFSTVNCDLILGLEGETAEDMVASAKALLELEPENITFHSLFLKKSSYLAQKVREGESANPLDGEVSALAAAQIYFMLEKAGYRPYYLYRQKYCVNNGENIGFSKPGSECFYNMAIMSDKRSVLGIGAGSTGKLYDPETNGYERMETVKNVGIYLETAREEGVKKAEILARPIKEPVRNR